VQSNRGYPVDDLVVRIIILDRCNSDTSEEGRGPARSNFATGEMKLEFVPKA
jgi:hypothetical protein